MRHMTRGNQRRGKKTIEPLFFQTHVSDQEVSLKISTPMCSVCVCVRVCGCARLCTRPYQQRARSEDSTLRPHTCQHLKYHGQPDTHTQPYTHRQRHSHTTKGNTDLDTAGRQDTASCRYLDREHKQLRRSHSHKEKAKQGGNISSPS
jgi:hypothetical protein